MKKQRQGAGLKLVTNTQEATKIQSEALPSPPKDSNYGQKPWPQLAGYVSPAENYLMMQARSLTGRDLSCEESKLLFQYVNIITRLPFPETDLAASRQQLAPPIWKRWSAVWKYLSAE